MAKEIKAKTTKTTKSKSAANKSNAKKTNKPKTNVVKDIDKKVIETPIAETKSITKVVKETKKSKPTSPKPISSEEKAFFDEVDEEVKNEKLKQLVNKYGIYFFITLIIALSFAIGYEKIADWKIHNAEKSNIQYTQALSPQATYEDNIIELENIVSTETGIYKDAARLQIANILLDNNQEAKAVAMLEEIFNDNNATNKIREIAIIKLATFKIDTSNFNEVKDLLNPLINSDSSWSNTASELLAMSAIANNDIDTAKSIYNNLLANEDISNDFRSRINDMLATINEM